MKVNLPLHCLLLAILLLAPTRCLSADNPGEPPLALTSECTYRIGSGDSKEISRALALYCARREAVIMAAKYFMHKGLLENYGPKQKEILCLAAGEIQAHIVAETHDPEARTYSVKIKTRPQITDFIKAEIKNLELEKQELQFSWQEEMEQHVYKSVDPGLEISRAYRYIRKKRWRIAIIYLNHLEKKYPNWQEIYSAKAISYYATNNMEAMMNALKTSCSLGNREACEDIQGFRQNN